jgi:hypothetical protein
MAKIVKGKYPYKDTEKLSKKKKRKEAEREQKKLLRKQDKQLKMQCDCNHLDSKKNKTHFKVSKDGMKQVCKICGGTLIRDPELLTEETAKSSADIVYTIFSLVRNRLNIDEETDRQITKTLLMVHRMPELLKLIKDQGKGTKKNKKKDKKNGKKNKSTFNRISY